MHGAWGPPNSFLLNLYANADINETIFMSQRGCQILNNLNEINS
jgi:hypothetical protein